MYVAFEIQDVEEVLSVFAFLMIEMERLFWLERNFSVRRINKIFTWHETGGVR